METLAIIYATPLVVGALTLESATLCDRPPAVCNTLLCAAHPTPAVVIARTGRVETDNSSAVDEASLPPSESQQFQASRAEPSVKIAHTKTTVLLLIDKDVKIAIGQACGPSTGDLWA